MIGRKSSRNRNKKKNYISKRGGRPRGCDDPLFLEFKIEKAILEGNDPLNVRASDHPEMCDEIWERFQKWKQQHPIKDESGNKLNFYNSK